MVCFIFSQPAPTSELVKIDVQKTELQLSIAIQYTGEINYESFTLSDPPRLVLDFIETEKISTEPLIEINDFGITNVRTGEFKPGTGRVVLTFEKEIPQHKIEETENGVLLLFWKEKVEEYAKPEEEKIEEEKIQPAEPEQEEKAEEIPEPKAEIEEMKPEPAPEKITEPVKLAPPALIEETTEQERKMRRLSAGLSWGYYFLRDIDFQDAYGNGGSFFRGEVAFLLPFNINSLDIWASAGYFQKSGQTTVTEEEIKLTFTSLSLAVRYLRNISRFTPFVGTGIDYMFFKETYPTDFPIASTSGSDLGFHFQAGSYIDILSFLSAKIQIRYILAKTMANEVEADLGGVEYSIGLVYRFNF